MSEAVGQLDAACARLVAELHRIDARLREIILDQLGDRPEDVPLHQRGFGVMDEPPA